MGMITLKEYAERHGKNRFTVLQKLKRGGFSTARKIGCQWFIDENEPYSDQRVKSGDFVNWRKGWEEVRKKRDGGQPEE